MLKGMYDKNKELINYLIVGVLTTIVSLVTYYLLVVTFLNPQNPVQLQIANIVSWIAAVLFAYFTNRKFVFSSNNPRILHEAISFFISRISTLLMDMGIMFLMVTIMGIDDKISKLTVQVIVTAANYILSKLVVFRKR